jgi:hypothetical protein
VAAPAIGIRQRLRPPVATDIDREHPLAVGLISAHIGTGEDLTGRYNLARYVTGGTGPLHADSAFGAGTTRGTVSNGSGYEIAIGTTHPLCLQPPLTLVWVGSLTSLESGNRILYGGCYNHAGTSPFLCAAISQVSTTHFAHFANSAGSFVQLSSAGGVDPTLGPHVVGITIASGERSIWVDGVRDQTSGTGITTINYGASSIFGFTDYNGVGPGVVNVLGLAYNRVLTATEFAMLQADPFCFLRR